MLNHLSETLLLTLKAAALRQDHLLELPAKSKGAVAKSMAGKLTAAGWAKEIKAPKHAPVWRRDAANGSAYALKLTPKGLKAIAGSEKAARASEAAGRGALQTDAPSQRQELDPAASGAVIDDGAQNGVTSGVRPPRRGSKLDEILIMLSAGTGATVLELGSATGWLNHSVRAALTGLRRRGYGVSLTRGSRDGPSVYRIAASGARGRSER